MLKKTNIVSVLLIAIGLALSLYHFVMGYGLGNHFYVGISGGFCIALGLLIHRVFAVAD
jgi:zinc transporter ZupT